MKPAQGLHIDDVYNKIGHLGWYQLFVSSVLSLRDTATAFHVFLYVFASADPGWDCASDSATCSKPNCTNLDAFRCSNLSRNDWEFSDSFTSTTTEWEMVCEEKYKTPLIQTALFAGWFFGGLISGTASNYFGRRKTYLAALVSHLVVGLLSAFMPNYGSYIVMRFLTGIAGCMILITGFVYNMEFIGISRRAFVDNVFGMTWPLGGSMLALAAYFIKDWKHLTILASLVSLIPIALWWFIPESPRWLLVNGKTDEAVEVLERIARGNKTEKELDGKKIILAVPPNTEEKVFFKELFQSSYLVKITIIGIITWFTVSLTNYGVVLGLGNLGGNKYLTFVLVNLTELPAYLLAIKLLNSRIGRRGSMFLYCFVCSLCFIGILTYKLIVKRDKCANTSEVAVITVALIAKMCMANAFNVIYLQNAELLPTTVRQTGIAVFNSAARVGGMLAPLIVTVVRDVEEVLPFGIFAALNLITACLALMLPETRGRNMIDSAADITDSANSSESMLNKYSAEDEPMIEFVSSS